MKKLISLLICIVAIYIVTTPKDLGAQALRVLLPVQGGTGISTSSPTDIGKCIKVLSDSPFKYELASCGGIGSDPTIIQVDGTPQSVGTPTLNFTGNSFAVTESPADTFSLRVSTSTLGLLASSISDFVATVRSSITEGVTGLTFTTGNLTLDSGYTIPTTTRAVNWDTAFGWGNHASQGYITDGNTNWDNSYNFITDGNTLWDNSYGFITQGSAVSTTTNGVTGQVAYWTGASTLGTVATGTLTDAVTGLQFDATRGLLGGSAILSLSTGYEIPTTTRMNTWDSAYLWGNHASQGYITDGNTNWDNSYGYVTQGQTVGTSTAGVVGQIPYWTGIRTLGTVATTSLTASGALSLSQPVSVIGSSASALTCLTASGSQNGCLSSTDWASFNGKVSSTSIDTLSELETLMSGINIIASTELDTETEFQNLVGGLNFITTNDTSAITPAMVFNTGLTDEFCLTYETTGSTWEWQTCGTGGGGGTGAGTATTTDNNAETGELITYTSNDFYVGGSASNTAEFNFDKDSARFTISSTTASATGTIFSQASALRIGSSTGEQAEFNFLTDNTLKLTSPTGITLFDLGSMNLSLGTVSAGLWNGTDIDVSDYTNLGVSALGLELSADSIALTSGYTIPTTTRAVNWDTAFGWGNHGSQGYLTTVDMSANTNFGVTATGLEESGDNLALTAGYSIPTTTRLVEHDIAYSWGNHAGLYDSVTTAGDGLTRTVNDFDCDIASASVFGCLSTTDWTTFMGKVATSSIDSLGEIETLTSVANILIENDIDASSELIALMDDETGIGNLVFSDSPTLTGGARFVGINVSASSTLGFASSTALTVSGNTVLASATSTNLFSTLGTFTNLVVNTLSTFLNVVVTGLLDVGGGVLEIPNGTAPVIDSIGEMGLDSTDDQLIMADGGGTARVFGTDEFRVVSLTMASSSLQFDSGDLLAVLGNKDGLEITQFRCYVVGGTSKVVNLTDGTNDTETITCATTMTSDTDVVTNDTFTADEIGSLEMGATTGTVNYLHFEAWARITRE